MTANQALLQFLADMNDLPVSRHCCIETSAWGAALLAGLGAGLYDLSAITRLVQHEKVIKPFTHFDREEKYAQWKSALARVL